MALTGKLPITWGTRAAMAAGTGGGAVPGTTGGATGVGVATGGVGVGTGVGAATGGAGVGVGAGAGVGAGVGGGGVIIAVGGMTDTCPARALPAITTPSTVPIKALF